MRVPASIPAVALLAGCAAGALAGLPLPPPLCVALACAGWLSSACFAARRGRLFLGLISFTFVASGWMLAAAADAALLSPPLLAAWREAGELPLAIEGTLREDAANWSNGVGLSLAVDTVMTRNGRTPAAGGVRLTVSGSQAAAHAAEWRAGRRLRLPAGLRLPTRYVDPGVRDARLASARRGTILVGGVKSASLVEVLSRGSVLDEGAAAVRARTRAAVGRHVGALSDRSAGIVVAILIGDRVGLEDEVERKLQEAGTYHVIAISGGNIAILAAAALLTLRLVNAGRRLASILVIALLCAYAFVVSGEASVTRATLMAALYLGARIGDFKGSPANTLAVSLAVILAAWPQSIFDVGAALTFGATLGILLGARLLALPRRARDRDAPSPRPPWWCRAWLRAPLGLLLASACAELALIPISALAFSRVTFAGLVLNFAAIPLMTVVQVAGMLVVPLDLIWPSAAALAGRVAHLGAAGLVRSADLVDFLPWLSYRLPPPHWIAVALYYAAWVAWLAAPRIGHGVETKLLKTVRRAAAGTIAITLVWIVVEPITLFWPGVEGRLRLAVLDVGHADAILVQLPDRRSLLVDAGGSLMGSSFDIGGRVVAPALWALRTRRLDLLVLTHGDPDHVGGAASVIRDFKPSEIWEGVPVPSLAGMKKLQAQAQAAALHWRSRLAGYETAWGDVTLRVWHPPPPDWERQKVRNDDSLVLEVRYRDVSIVLAGDVGRPVELELAGRFEPSPVRVLKVPHHGSATSSSAAFVQALHPTVAVISAGPSTKVAPAVLARYEAEGSRLYRTDRDGAVIITSDGHSLRVGTER